MVTAVGRGLLAGAAGTAVLNAVTYADMAWRGRDASTTPEQTVDALADALGVGVPGHRRERDNRLTALGALSGTLTGLAVGVAASAARSAGIRLPGGLGVAATTALAMATADVPLGLLGVSDPRSWSAADWVADAVPHLAYGLTVHGVVGLTETARERAGDVDPPARASLGLVVRSALLGVATGGRSSLGLAGPVLSTRRAGRSLGPAGGRVGSTVSLLAVAGELVADKLPGTPSRLAGPGLPLRLVAGALGAGALAHRSHARAWLPVLAGAAGAAAGSYAGAGWRSWAGQRLPGPGAALIEDAAALALAALASAPGAR